MGEPAHVVSKLKLSTKVESAGHWLVEDHARIWEVLKTEEVRQLLSDTVDTVMYFLRLEIIILSVAIIIGQLGSFLFWDHRHNHSWRIRSQGCVPWTLIILHSDSAKGVSPDR